MGKWDFSERSNSDSKSKSEGGFFRRPGTANGRARNQKNSQDSVDNAGSAIRTVCALAEKVNAKFDESEGHSGGAVGQSVVDALGESAAVALGLSQAPEVTHVAGPGMGSSSSEEEEY